MSYSFAIRAASLAAASAAVAAELDKVCEIQPVHEHDRQLADGTIAGALAMIEEPSEGNELAVSVAGSLGWNQPEPTSFTGISLNIQIYTVAKTG